MNESSKKSRKKARKKIEQVDDDEEAELPAGQAGEQVLDPDVAVDAVEDRLKTRRADQDEDDEAATASSVVSIAWRSRLQAQAAARERHDEGAGRAHRAALGRRGHAEEDGAQHEEDQRRAAGSARRSPLGHAREQSQLEGPVDQRRAEREADADAHRARRCARRVAASAMSGLSEHRSTAIAAITASTAITTSERRPAGAVGSSRIVRASGGSAGAQAGLKIDTPSDVEDVERRQHEARDEGALVHVADASVRAGRP